MDTAQLKKHLRTHTGKVSCCCCWIISELLKLPLLCTYYLQYVEVVAAAI